jgi:hypothetical protein
VLTKSQHILAERKGVYAKHTDKNVMHSKNLKIRLSKTRDKSHYPKRSKKQKRKKKTVPCGSGNFFIQYLNKFTFSAELVIAGCQWQIKATQPHGR